MKITLILSLFILLLITSFMPYWALSGDNIINNGRAEKLKMKSDIKGDLISLLQSRMDKCTTEQFWAVGIITGLSAFLISQRSKIQKRLIIIIVQVILSLYGIGFVWHRHISFYELEGKLSCLLADEKIAPKMLKLKHDWWDWRTLTGVGFYTFWIVLTCAGVFSCYIRPLENQECPYYGLAKFRKM
jgi:hypothetical protein